MDSNQRATTDIVTNHDAKTTQIFISWSCFLDISRVLCTQWLRRYSSEV